MQFMQPKEEQAHWEVEEIDEEGNPVNPTHHDEL